MYIIFLSLIAVTYTVSAVINGPKIKKLAYATVTEEKKVRLYIEGTAFGWIYVLAVLAMCIVAKISPGDIGLAPVNPSLNIWFNIITFVLCGGFFLFTLYQAVGFLTSAKMRETIKKQFTDVKDGHHDAVILFMIPRSKKEKRWWFLTSLTAGIGEEIILRGFLYFLIQTVFPGISVILVVLLASLFFGICHLYQGLAGVAKTSAVGAMIGCLYLASGSLIPGILLHFFIDFAGAFLLSEEE
jgi:membrane protease YdiL (CAAX protease family)